MPFAKKLSAQLASILRFRYLFAQRCVHISIWMAFREIPYLFPLFLSMTLILFSQEADIVAKFISSAFWVFPYGFQTSSQRHYVIFAKKLILRWSECLEDVSISRNSMFVPKISLNAIESLSTRSWSCRKVHLSNSYAFWTIPHLILSCSQRLWVFLTQQLTLRQSVYLWSG